MNNLNHTWTLLPRHTYGSVRRAAYFIYVAFVTSLVPSWIPGGVFWTYFTSVALIAGGAGMCVPPTSRLAAILSGLMIFVRIAILEAAAPKRKESASCP